MSIGEFNTLLTKYSLKVTNARVSIFKVLNNHSVPISAEHIQQKAKLDKVTVYRTLDTFLQLGIIREIDLRQGRVLFELTNRPEHHHIVCTQCGMIEDVQECVFNRLKDKVLKQSGFARVTDHAMEFFGLCKQCA